jgi:hypothetical protein
MKKLNSSFADVTAKMCLDCGGLPQSSNTGEDAGGKRKRGRPKKNDAPCSAQAKNPVGRPRRAARAMVSEYGASSASSDDDGAIERSEASSFRGAGPSQPEGAVTRDRNRSRATRAAINNNENEEEDTASSEGEDEDEDEDEDDEPIQPLPKRAKGKQAQLQPLVTKAPQGSSTKTARYTLQPAATPKNKTKTKTKKSSKNDP